MTIFYKNSVLRQESKAKGGVKLVVEKAECSSPPFCIHLPPLWEHGLLPQVEESKGFGLYYNQARSCQIGTYLKSSVWRKGFFFFISTLVLCQKLDFWLKV